MGIQYPLVFQVDERFSVTRIAGQGRSPERLGGYSIASFEPVRSLCFVDASRATDCPGNRAITDTDLLAIWRFDGAEAVSR